MPVSGFMNVLLVQWCSNPLKVIVAYFAPTALFRARPFKETVIAAVHPDPDV